MTPSVSAEQKKSSVTIWRQSTCCTSLKSKTALPHPKNRRSYLSMSVGAVFLWHLMNTMRRGRRNLRSYMPAFPQRNTVPLWSQRWPLFIRRLLLSRRCMTHLTVWAFHRAISWSRPAVQAISLVCFPKVCKTASSTVWKSTLSQAGLQNSSTKKRTLPLRALRKQISQTTILM